MSRPMIWGMLAALLCLGGSEPDEATGPSATLIEGFETDRPTWRQEDTDATVRLLAHDRTERARHDGGRSERFLFQSPGLGSALYYSYALPPIPLEDDLEVSLYVRSSQPGVQLLAQVILPADTDPDTGEPAFVRVAGETSTVADRWQRLEMADLKAAVERQVRILRYQTRRPIPLEGAYLDRLVVNLFCGGGEVEVFLDDLRISPVPDEVVLQARTRLDAGGEPITPDQIDAMQSQPATPVQVALDGGHLTRNGRDWFPSILRAPGADLEQALPFGFDAVSIAVDTPADRLDAVTQREVALMPDLGVLAVDGVEPANEQRVLTAIGTFARPDSVAFWDLGSTLGAYNDASTRQLALDRSREVLDGVRLMDGDRANLSLVTGTVVGDYTAYAMPGQSLDLMGVRARFWGSSVHPAELLEQYRQRRNLTALWNVHAPYWAWVEVAVPPLIRTAVWGLDAPPAWGAPRVQPEQVRLASYTAMMAGFRGLGFLADADLTRPASRSLLYELGLLNAEIDLVEPILAQGTDPIQYLSAYPPDPNRLQQFRTSIPAPSLSSNDSRIPKELAAHESIRVAAISTRDGRGRLLLIADLAAQSQWQPGQLAFNDLSVTVPGAPPSAQALEIRLGGARWLDRDRVPGGVRFTLPEFGVATMVLLTTDINSGEQIRRNVDRIRPRAVDLALKQARDQLVECRELNGRLALDGHYARDAADLLNLAERSLNSAEQARNREDFELAWDEARRVTRPVRLLMKAHWDLAYGRLQNAVGGLRNRERAEASRTTGTPPGPQPPLLVPVVACPALVAFQTLPQHFVWCDWIETARFSANLVATGTLEALTPQDLADAGWMDAGHRDAGVESTARLVPAEKPEDQGRGQALRLSVIPVGGRDIDAAPPMMDLLAAAIDTPPIPVKARQFYRISALVKLPREVPGHAGGLVIRDSLGGESLQFRSTRAIPDWSEVVLFRRVPADGSLTVTLGLAGYGEAWFDDIDVRLVEQLGDEPAPAAPEVVQTPAPATPDPADASIPDLSMPLTPAAPPSPAAPTATAEPRPLR